jgi:hypothetical protein
MNSPQRPSAARLQPKKIFTAETQRRREKQSQSQNRRAQRWRTTQRGIGPGYRRLSGLGSRESSRLAKILAVRSKKIFTAETQRRREKQSQSQNRRAQRWRRTQRGIGPGYWRLSGLGSRESSRLAKIPAVSSKKIFTAETQRRREKQSQSQNRRAQRWQRTQRGKGPGCQRLSGPGSRESSRLAKIMRAMRAASSCRRPQGRPKAQGWARWPASLLCALRHLCELFLFLCSSVPLCLCGEFIRPRGEMVNL